MAFVALFFSMVSIKLMMIVENAQIIVIGTIGQHLMQPDRIVALAMGAHKFLMIKIGIVFFSKVSALMFSLQDEMYSAKVVQVAAATLLSTVLIGTRTKVVAAKRHAKHAAKKVRGKVASISTSFDRKTKV